MEQHAAFSIIIPWSNRPELITTIAENTKYFAKANREVVIVNAGGDCSVLRELVHATAAVRNLRVISFATGLFNRALCCNIGAANSSHSFLFFLDADVILQSDVLGEAAPLLEGRLHYVKIRKVVESQPYKSERTGFLKEEIITKEYVCKDEGRRARLEFRLGGDGSRCGSGLLIVRRDHLEHIGGFNSNLTGWGYEDIDFQLRLQFELNIRQSCLGQVLHLTHSDDVRGLISRSTQDDYAKNMMTSFKNYTDGCYKGTYIKDSQEKVDVLWL